MELLYIWIEDYKNIKEQGFNFSSKHRFEFIPEKDKDGKIIGGKLHHHHEDNPNHIENFFGENITNVTAIIGENGAGKSSLLEAIMDILQKYILDNWKYLIILLDKENILNISSSFDNTNYPKYINDIKNTSWQYETHQVFYKEVFDIIDKSIKFQRHNNGHFFDLSINKLLSEKNEGEYIYEDMYRLILFLTTSSIKQNYILHFPDYLGLNYSTMTWEFATSIEGIEEYLSKICNEEYLKFSYRIKYIFIFLNWDRRSKDLHSMSKNVFNKEFERLYIKKNKNTSKQDLNELFKLLTDKRVYEKTNKIPVYLIKEKQKIYKIINLIEKTNLQEYFLMGWQWKNNLMTGEMSSGELKFLTLLSKFYSIKKNVEQAKNLVILIDEGELGFHPQWQKEYLKILIDFLPQIFPNKKIQIILTSHSPFLVSDLPKENIIFLSKNEKGECVVSKLQDRKETFGANIHTLFTDSFFMKGGLMGTFAEKRINEVIAYLNGESIKESLFNGKTPKEQQELAEKYISMIGEPIIRNMLQKQLNHKRLKQVENHEDRIRKLEEELEALRKKGDYPSSSV